MAEGKWAINQNKSPEEIEQLIKSWRLTRRILSEFFVDKAALSQLNGRLRVLHSLAFGGRIVAI